MQGWRAAADIGGTFTDLVLVDPDGRPAATTKLLTTSDDPARAVLEGLDRLLAVAELEGGKLGGVLHGTTLVTNSLIERRGARTALVTTEGFRDVLEIGRENRYELYDLDIELPAPLVRRHLRFEVPERVLADGTVRRELDEGAVEELAAELRDHGIESVAVVFLHSYMNPDHERRAAAVLERLLGIDVTTSAEVLPEMNEFARTSTTVTNAFVRPLVRRYLEALQDAIGMRAPAAELSLITSTGRITPIETAEKTPIRLLESGPAGGVLAGVAVAREAGVEDLLAFDMGGTTAKASYVTAGRPRIATAFEVARVKRFARGSGLPVQLPSIELIEIGAGGGSIAWVDELGLLRVGPQSSGSDPGPVCYARGGEEPTVTDADLALGYLGPDSFLGGEMVLDVEAARRALKDLASRLDLTDESEAAVALRRVVDEQMALAARRHAVEQGLDPARFTLVATGGAGPVHACSVAHSLGIPTVLVPPGAGVASAHGFLGAAFGYDAVRSAPSPADGLDWGEVRGLIDELEYEAARASRGHTTRRRVEADMRYRGQGAAVTVEVDDDIVAGGDGEGLVAALAEAYERRYGRVPEGVPAEVLTWRVAAWGDAPEVAPLPVPAHVAGGEREVYFGSEGDFVSTPVLGWGDADGEGPMIVEQRESTLVVPPGARVTRTDGGSILVSLP